ncbi:MerR family transcriptional regulator [Rarobacter incanus]|uniref:DNA-binding transcriptional MerR regulator n=1 Tax=Rarobacter incanus TaxID=153494 RepID=A0A542SR59_9MICO|nr:MerR family transcriptional regulator [Rarobacter incanus]TQK77110.1 DNA-binding transcriptional MerR regulator [Rarobacter incanus]
MPKIPQPSLGDSPAQGGTPAPPGWTVAAVAKKLGVAPGTLRTWDRRYGLGPSTHAAGSHRRYNVDDFARLVIMRKLALEGVAPQDAARAALAAQVDGSSVKDLEEELKSLSTSAPVGMAPGADPARSAHESPGASIFHLPTAPNRGLVTAQSVIEAVLAGKQQHTADLLTIQSSADPLDWWLDIVQPAVTQLSERTVLARPGEAPELLLLSESMAALGRFVEALDAEASRRGVAAGHPSRNRNLVLVFVAPSCVVSLAAHVFAATLLARGVTARVVTGPASAHRAAEIVAMVRPRSAVVLTESDQPDAGLVRALNEGNPELPIFVGVKGAGVPADMPLAPTIQRIRSFTGMVHEVLAVTSQ